MGNETWKHTLADCIRVDNIICIALKFMIRDDTRVLDRIKSSVAYTLVLPQSQSWPFSLSNLQSLHKLYWVYRATFRIPCPMSCVYFYRSHLMSRYYPVTESNNAGIFDPLDMLVIVEIPMFRANLVVEPPELRISAVAVMDYFVVC